MRAGLGSVRFGVWDVAYWYSGCRRTHTIQPKCIEGMYVSIDVQHTLLKKVLCWEDDATPTAPTA